MDDESTSSDVGDVEVVVAAGAELGEGPVWDERSGRLVWIDILARRIHLTDPRSGATDTIEVPLHVGAVAPRRAGGFIAALQDGFWVVDDGEVRRIATVPEAGPRIRFNDGKCDPAGRFWAGTLEYGERDPVGSLYRLDTDGSVTRIVDGITISNGIGWSPDATTMYYVDSPTGRIDAWAYDDTTGTITNRRTEVSIPAGQGGPDGLTVDAAGGIWVALWDGWAVHRYVDGRLDRTVRLPVSRPTSCTFGGPGLDELYITSAWIGLSAADRQAQPLAGSLFRVRLDVAGLPPASYAGD